MKALKLSKLLIVLSSFGLVLSGCSLLPNMEPPSKPQEQTDDKDDEHKDDEKKTYTVTWKNWDESVLEIDTDVPDGTLPTYDGMEPTKPNDEYYTYSFNGWYPNIRNVHSDQTYNAKFYSTPIYQPTNTYIIEWKNWNGEMLEVDYDVPEGTWPTYNGPTPFRPSDDFYDYNFNGWSPSLHLVNDNQTYDAVFESVEKERYTITWLNWDSSYLEVDYNVPEGTWPEYNGLTPTKPEDDRYTYAFAGWDPVVSEVTGHCTYIAQFYPYAKPTPTFTVIWKNWNGDILETDYFVPSGSFPEYNGATPTRPADGDYTYEFDGWSPSFGPINSNATFTAQYNAIAIPRYYQVTWVNWNNEVLLVQNYLQGSLPEYNGSTPTRPNENGYYYVFTGWSPIVSEVYENVIYTAIFEEYLIPVASYTITWLNYDGGVLSTSYVEEGNMPEYNGATPTKPEDANYTYTFSGWNPAVSAATGDCTYTAEFETILKPAPKYTVTWYDYDGTTMLYQNEFEEGSAPEYAGPTPVRAEDESFTYEFMGWDPAPTLVYSDRTYTAQYMPTHKPVKITWVNYDGTPLITEQLVDYGITPIYPGSTPTRPEDDTYTYEFSGWSPEITSAYNNQVYTAQYDATLKHVHTFTDVWSGDEYNHWHPSTCGHDVVADFYPHTFGEWVVDSESTTEEHGQKHRTCSVCGYTETQELPLIINNDDRFYYYETEGGYGISGLKDEYKDLEEVVIPRRYNGELVVEIGGYSFGGNQSIKSVTLPSSVKTIGSEAFGQCFNLERVIIPEDSALTEIGGYVFNFCIHLKEINIPDAITRIDNSTFYYCWSLYKVNISQNSNLTAIGENAFLDCISLTSITLPSKLESIGDGAFASCCRLIEVNNQSNLSFALGSDDFGGIAKYARHICDDSNSSVEIDEDGFVTYDDGDEKLLIHYVGSEEVVNIPEGITGIASHAFYGYNSSLNGEYMMLTDHVKIRKIIVPEGVTTIESNAFDSCESLLQLILPSSLVSFEENSIVGCEKLYEIVNKSDLNIYYAASNINDESKTTIVEEDGFLISNNVCLAYVGNAKTATIPSHVYRIVPYAFAHNKTLEELIIPDSVINMGYRTFRCSNIQKVTLSNSITKIDDCTFEYCRNLKTITIPDSVTEIGSSAFCNCTSLEAIIFGEDSQLQTIASAFDNCASLEELNIGKHVSSIDDFFNLPGLTSINVSEDNEYYSSVDGVLYDKNQTILIRFPENKEFDLSEMPETVTTIKAYGFYHCYSIEVLVIPDGIKVLEHDALFGLDRTNTFVLPASIESIGSWCLSSKGDYTSFTYLGTMEQWNSIDIDDNAFPYCTFVIHCSDGDIILSNNP